jgi:hypothetical protein
MPCGVQVLDQALCGWLNAVGNPQFHGWWHVLMGIGSCVSSLSLFSTRSFANAQTM